MDRVCSWLDAVATVQNSGKSAHPDDLRAGILPLTHTHTKCTFSLSLSLSLAQRIARSLEAISLYPTKPDTLSGQLIQHSV